MSFKDTEIGKIPLDWEIAELGELADVLSGYAFKGKDFVDYGIPVIKIKNIVPPYVSIDDVQYVSEQIFNESKKYQLKYNDILISMTGSNYNQMSSAVGKVGKIRLNNTPMLLNQRVGKIIPNENLCNKEFIYYNISTMETRYRLALSAGGSANQANISPKQIKSLKIPIPPIEEQKAIAHILSTLDEKIEVNNQINKTLENMAQAIFKQWFVDFEFPNEDGEPYKSSGGEMVESELGMIPKGWEVKELGDVVEFQNGYAFKSKDLLDKEQGDCYRVFKMGHIIKGGGLNKEGTKSFVPKKDCLTLARYLIKKGDLLMCMTDMKSNVALLGHTALMDEDDKYILNQRVGLLRTIDPSIINYPYLYILSNSKDFIENLRSRANSGVQVNLSTKEIKETLIIVPSKHIHKKYNDITEKVFAKSFNIAKENEVLKNARDTLLPKLMSGEIRVTLDEEGEVS